MYGGWGRVKPVPTRTLLHTTIAGDRGGGQRLHVNKNRGPNPTLGRLEGGGGVTETLGQLGTRI